MSDHEKIDVKELIYSQGIQQREVHKKFEAQLQNMEDNFDTKMQEINLKLDPMYKLYEQATGFNLIARYIIYTLTAIGGLILLIRSIFHG